MDKPRPPKLFAKGGKGDLVPHADGFGAIPSIKDWYGSGVDGIKHNLTTELRSYSNGILGALSTQTGEGVDLARHLNRQVISQWNDFVSFDTSSSRTLDTQGFKGYLHKLGQIQNNLRDSSDSGAMHKMG